MTTKRLPALTLPSLPATADILAPNPAPRGDPPHDHRLSVGGRIGTFLGITVPFAGLVAAGVLLWGRGFNWVDLALMAGMYLVTLLGVTVGFHRHLVHRSFEAVMPVRVLLAVMGSMAVQGNVFKWAGLHRRHHQHSDTPDDVHSPHHSGDGLGGFLLGVWHSHIGWAFYADPPKLERYIKDLTAVPALRLVDRLFILWAALGFVIPAAVGGLVAGSWMGALTGAIWGGLVRLFLVHHVTWSINSACHLWGKKPYDSGDESRNNVVFGVLAFGEGWHNTHHAFPTSARHGLEWWQLDLSWWVIRAMSAVGLVWNVKLPSESARLKAKAG